MSSTKLADQFTFDVPGAKVYASVSVSKYWDGKIRLYSTHRLEKYMLDY